MKLTTISVFLLACLSLKAAVETQYLQGLTSPVQANIDSRVLDSGDTMTGNLQWSGTTIPGLRPNNLTAVQIGNLVAPPVGSTVFNTTSLQLNMWDGAVWNELRTGNYLPIAGGTLTGNLLWNNTAVSGLRLNNLTTVQRDATTPAAGNLIWNTTTARVNNYTGSVWNDGWVRLGGDTMTGALVNNPGVSITASAPNRIVQQWNNAGVAFNALEINITSDANLSSTFVDFYDDTVRRFWITSGGTVNATQFIAGTDAVILRDAANTVGQRNGATAQTHNLYGTYTDASNYRRLRSTMSTGGAATIAAEGLGTGVSGNQLIFTQNGTTVLSFNSGSAIATFGASLLVPTSNGIGWTASSYFAAPSDGIIRLTQNSGSGFTRLNFGGDSASFPSIKRSGTELHDVLANDSGFAARQSLYDRSGSGSPEGVVTAPVGATYHRNNGGAGTSLYVKESGSGNTGWVAK